MTPLNHDSREMKKAEECLVNSEGRGYDFITAKERVAQALLEAKAEQREADARIAASMKEYRKSIEPEFMFGQAWACEDIAIAILNQKS